MNVSKCNCIFFSTRLKKNLNVHNMNTVSKFIDLCLLVDSKLAREVS